MGYRDSSEELKKAWFDYRHHCAIRGVDCPSLVDFAAGFNAALALLAEKEKEKK